MANSCKARSWVFGLGSGCLLTAACFQLNVVRKVVTFHLAAEARKLEHSRRNTSINYPTSIFQLLGVHCRTASNARIGSFATGLAGHDEAAPLLLGSACVTVSHV